ncbi:general secretion pathway protein GspB [Thalassomonas haliotis]|uniref:General secretion pathway protein GspB n=1 Tax=Thalassomonas haliotis TaxID=485448 RepID=A0ABY7VGZ7_9GAMM|nr:general secretion pathway protein GspB [Thalassomonas haliotis]WDE12995.1 general secretion pathway protein GspB [Thalassomonas haliotis]
MSYILEALKKEQPGQGQAPTLQSAPVPVAIETRSASIAWGVLLTLAIFAALLAGYWLGQNNQQGQVLTANQQALPQAQIQAAASLSADIQAQALKPASNKPVAETATVPATKGALAVNSGSEKIAAESYFEHPPVIQKKEAAEQAQLLVSAEKPKQLPLAFKVAAQEGISDDLLARFQSAIDETGNAALEENSEDEGVAPETSLVAGESGVTPLGNMPLWVQQGIPDLQFELHIFASDGEGWIRVNGEDKYQGDRVAEDLILTQILPQQVILNYRGENFSLPALSNWSAAGN